MSNIRRWSKVVNTAGRRNLPCREARYPFCEPTVLVILSASTTQMLTFGVKHTLCLLLLMVQTSFVTAFAPRTKDSHDTVQCLMEWMDTFHCTPLSVCADMAFQSNEVQDLFRRLNIRPFFSTGPYTPWPNRAEAAVRVLFKETLHDLCSQIGSAPELKQVTVRELFRKTAVVRHSMVTYGGKKLCRTCF